VMGIDRSPRAVGGSRRVKDGGNVGKIDFTERRSRDTHARAGPAAIVLCVCDSPCARDYQAPAAGGL
jgi:hypothetical protein